MAKQQTQKTKETAAERRLARTQERIHTALSALHHSVLGPLMDRANVHICEGTAGEPKPIHACVDAAQGAVFINPFVSAANELSHAEWLYVIAHLLLHLALNHHERGRNLEPVPWNLAACAGADRMLKALHIGTPPPAYAPHANLAALSEDEAYESILLDPRAAPPLNTFAGPGRPDMIVSKFQPDMLYRSYGAHSHTAQPNWELLFAEGIRQAVERAVRQAAELQEATDVGCWPPLERAKRWVMNHMPLLGALAAQVRIVADAKLCERMDIGIAAVNEFLGEMYFNPERRLSDAETLFVYVHELLHVALLHGSRLQGRDPEVWNFACDFVINGWLIEMGVGSVPKSGLLYDPRLKNCSAEEVYDLLIKDRKRCRGLYGFRGKLGDILLERGQWTIRRDDVTTMDDIVRRCMAAGMECAAQSRGLVPVGLLEEIKSLFTPPVPWDVELARWMDAHVPMLRDPLRSYARASRRQASTPDIPRPARYVPQEWKEACTFGVVMDTSGSMDRGTLGRALGAIASYSEARDVPAVRLVMCDAAPYDCGMVAPTELRGIYPVIGRGGTVLQPAVNLLLGLADFPAAAPIMIITDGFCEEEVLAPREHCFLLPRKGWKEGGVPLRTNAPVFRVLKD